MSAKVGGKGVQYSTDPWCGRARLGETTNVRTRRRDEDGFTISDRAQDQRWRVEWAKRERSRLPNAVYP